jgi:hypothetical protein
MTYNFALESVWHPPLAFADASQSPLPPELELQALWFSGAFGRTFQSDDGKSIRIVQFGEWNRTAGPDFVQAAIEINGELKAGPIELDSSTTDWETHGHSANPCFREVILHVVFQCGPRTSFTRTDDHRLVPRVVMPQHLIDEALNRPLRETAIAHPGRCLRPLRHMPASSIGQLLAEAAEHRAANKIARFLRAADAHGRDAALFQATAETLGYRGNSLAMRVLAQRAPLAVLHADPDAREAILFGTAGFLSPELHEQAPPDTREYIRGLWDVWWKHRARFDAGPDRAIPWKLHGQRPANHPHRRVGTLAVLASVWPKYRRLALARPFQTKPLLGFLESLTHPLWSHRHTLTSAPSARPISLFGRAQALELLANHLIPLAIHEEGFTFASYYKIRNSTANDRVKRCALRLFGSAESAKPWLRHLARHQAMLQIYHDFCLEDTTECVECPFPEQLSQWRA